MTMPTEFARNQWYVVAATDEVGATPLARTVCGEHIVLFRDGDDAIVALPDRCPHRGYPLSVGQVMNGEIECGYHGLRFNNCGACTWAPNQAKIPSRANIEPYALATTGPWIWIWIGDRDADHGTVPNLFWLDDPDWTEVHGMEPLGARYGLLVDNLLDLSHESFLHAGSIGTPEVALTPIETTVDDDTNTVYVSRHMEAVECPPFYEKAAGLSTPIDRWQDIEYHPVCTYILHSRVAPAGTKPHDDGTDPDAAHLTVLYAITPVDKYSTMDFWALARDFGTDDEELSASMAAMNRSVILEDVAALELIERRLQQETEPSEVSLKIDTGALAARRMIDSMTAAPS